MFKILLACSAGMSTTLLEESMKIYAASINEKSNYVNSQISNNLQIDISNSKFFSKGDLHEFYTTREKFKRYFIDLFYGVL